MMATDDDTDDDASSETGAVQSVQTALQEQKTAE
jgi:hypothetical protein